jgi:alanyl-tRNA synthetase
VFVWVEQAQVAIESAAGKGEAFLVLEVGIAADSKAVKRVVEACKKAAPELALLGLSKEDPSSPSRLLAFAHVPKSRQGSIQADKWVAAALEAVGGRGGGKADLAQGQAKEVGALDGSVQAAQDFAKAAFG